jgi:hypothetical protein
MAVSDEDGRLEVKNLPVGAWTFQFWHERSGYVSELKIDGRSRTWRRGRSEIEIKPGGNDMGEVTLPEALFEK